MKLPAMDTAPTQHLFELALQHHQSGRLKEAQAAYQQILALSMPAMPMRCICSAS